MRCYSRCTRAACYGTRNANGEPSEIFAGREFDGALLADPPQDVDPCGENGEFHTFVYDGPIFKRPVPFTVKGVEALRYPEVDRPYWRCIIE